jgi:uncharacterized protein YdhG (YjbR/CyaY superfamily)
MLILWVYMLYNFGDITSVSEEHKRVYPKVSGLAAWSENCKMVELSATKCNCIAIL